jgi:hypothetical protein
MQASVINFAVFKGVIIGNWLITNLQLPMTWLKRQSYFWTMTIDRTGPIVLHFGQPYLEAKL